MKISSRCLSLFVVVYVSNSVVWNALWKFVFEGFDYALGFYHWILNHRTNFIRWYLIECKVLDRQCLPSRLPAMPAKSFAANLKKEKSAENSLELFFEDLAAEVYAQQYQPDLIDEQLWGPAQPNLPEVWLGCCSSIGRVAEPEQRDEFEAPDIFVFLRI